MNVLDKIRIKEVDDLNDEDKKILKENWEDLTPEEQDVFNASVNPPEDNIPREGEDDPDDNSEDDPDKNKPDDKKEELPFKTKEEMDAYILAKVKELSVKPDDKKKDEDAPSEDDIDIPDLFEAGYKPDDWNQFTRDLLKKAGPTIAKLTEKQFEAKRSNLQKQLEVINKQIDDEIDAIGVDIPKLGTEERTKLNESLAKISTDYHMEEAPMAKVYEIYKMTLKDKKDVPADQKNLANKINKTSGGGGGENKKPTLKDIRNKSMSTLLEEAGVV